MQIALMSGATTRKLTSVGMIASAALGESSKPAVSCSMPTPSTIRWTGTTTAADSARNVPALRR